MAVLLSLAGEDAGRGDVADCVTLCQRLDRRGGHPSAGHDQQLPHALEVRLQGRQPLPVQRPPEALLRARLKGTADQGTVFLLVVQQSLLVLVAQELCEEGEVRQRGE